MKILTLDRRSGESRAEHRSSRRVRRFVLGFVYLFTMKELVSLAFLLYLQTVPTAPMTFEVASVKPNTSMSRGPGSRVLGCRGIDGEVGDPTPLNRCVIRRFPLRWIIAFAHGIPLSRIDLDVTGGPAWIDSDLYDVDAKAEADATTTELKAMLRTLLADQFRLKT